jgi:PAS domain S-box-containing protein
MNKKTRHLLGYGVAIVAVTSALALIAIPQIGQGLILLLFLAVFVSAAYGGIGPGLFATGLITVIAGLGPLLGESDIPPWRVVAILAVVAGGTFITLVVEALRAARSRAEAGQQWLSAVLASIGDAVIAADAQGRVSFMNPVARNLTGWGPEAIGRPLAEVFRIVNEDTGALVENPIERVQGAGVVVGLAKHKVLIARDGMERPVEESGAPVTEKGGTITGVVLVFRDVSERRRAEAVQARLAAIVESSDDAIIGKDLDGVITSWNAAAERIFGYAAAEIVGRPIELLVPTDRRAQESDALARLQRGERVGHLESIRSTKHGRSIDVATTVSPIRDGTGRLIGASRIVRDISDWKQAERALEQRAWLLEQAFDPIMASEFGGAITYWNDGARRLYGFTAAQAVGQVSHVLLQTIFPPGLAKIDEALREHGHWDGELRQRTKDGRWVTVDSRMSLVRQSGQPVLVLEANRDITERRMAEEQLRENEAAISRLNSGLEKRLERLSALRRIDQAITASLDLRHTLDVVLTQVLDQLDVAAASVLLVESVGQVLECAADKGFRTGPMRPARLSLKKSLAGRITMGRRASPVVDLTQAPEEFTRADFAAQEGFCAYAAIPLIAKAQIHGLMEVFHRTALEPSSEWWSFFEALAGQAAIAIENATLFEGLQHAHRELAGAYDATIEGWSQVLDLRDRQTEGHSRRVTELTLELARSFGMSPDRLVHIRRGALLHDIGKLGIPDSILLKQGPLDDGEWQIMKRHPEFAFEWLSPISYLRPALDIPRCHHERWDGTGYPRGLKGEEIPLEARIFAAVDVFDALSHDRPYRQAWPAAQVTSHLRSLAGTHLEEQVVDAFVRNMAPDSDARFN